MAPADRRPAVRRVRGSRRAVSASQPAAGTSRGAAPAVPGLPAPRRWCCGGYEEGSRSRRTLYAGESGRPSLPVVSRAVAHAGRAPPADVDALARAPYVAVAGASGAYPRYPPRALPRDASPIATVTRTTLLFIYTHVRTLPLFYSTLPLIVSLTHTQSAGPCLWQPVELYL
jgi:hypothetical protein